jgi:tellurite resistance-related uncharacterized protein
MKDLPVGVVEVRRTAEFTEQTVPAGLLRAHTTKAHTWAQIRVVEGRLRYRTLAPPSEHLLDAERPGVVEPEVPHEVEPVGPVRFYVVFLREP